MRWVLYSAVVITGCCRLVAAVPVQNEIDRLVFARQAETGYPPSELCSDEVFIRRAFLDVIGTLPTAKETREFLASKAPDKRRQLTDYLLDHEAFADYWSLKWCDLLRVKSEFPANLWPNAVQAYHCWIRNALRDGMPYDEFARALLTSSGSNFRDPPVNFYRPFQERTPRKLLDTAALVFMGTRLDKNGWSEDQLLGMDAYFATVSYKKTDEWKEEIVYSDPLKRLTNAVTGKIISPVPPGEVPQQLDPFSDPRVAFADWLTAPDNPWFAKAIVNRIWFWLMGRGIVHEADDLRPDNPAWCPELLTYLEKELIRGGYDLKTVYRLILNSSTYQLSSVASPQNRGDEAGFSHYRIRRMDAEVLIDAISQITGTGEGYTSAIPEPFTYVPASQRTILLADGSIKSPFLEMFGRPGRDSSLESDRNNSVSVFQTLHLLNSSHIQQKIMNGTRLRTALVSNSTPQKQLDQLYLTILSRFPDEVERQIALSYMKESDGSAGFYDVAWALINSTEFILKH